MAPRPSGQIIERTTARGRVFALRFRAYGRRHFVTLGGADDGWTRQKTEAELRHVLADVEGGLWTPPAQRAAAAPSAPTFHEFASAWLEARRGELRETSIADYSWRGPAHRHGPARAHGRRVHATRLRPRDAP